MAATKEQRPYSEVCKGYTPFQNGDLLVAKITPCFENGKIAQAVLNHHYGFGSTEFHVVRAKPARSDARYLLHFLRQDSIRRDGERKMTGSAGQRRVPEHFLAGLDIPLPPLAEQRRLADILDRSEALRAKRRAALALLDTLTQATFLDIFGDPVTNPKGWPDTRLLDVLDMPLRNGLSPSKSGKLQAKVLTLSAVTGHSYNADAWKTSTFQCAPPADQRVNGADFLICRGNGNLHLVGKGYFPTFSQPDVTFPDTIIAARVSAQCYVKAFFQHFWNTNRVRQQIDILARTTNGTFKVNQSAIESVVMLAPPLPLQHEFARRVAMIEQLRSAQRKSLAKLDELFASLQHRAFRGEL